MILRKSLLLFTFGWLMFVATLFVNINVNTALTGLCYEETNITDLSPFLHVLSSADNDTIYDTPESCVDQCTKLLYNIAFVESANLCHCANEIPAQIMNSTFPCNTTCADNSTCGGEVQTVYTIYNKTDPLTGYLELIPPASLTVAVSQPIVITVNASGSYVIFMENEVTKYTNVTTDITFQNDYPGLYTVSAYLEDIPTFRSSLEIKVVQAPNVVVTCPPSVAVNETTNCSVVFKAQGYDSAFSYTLGSTSESYKVPEEILFQVGTPKSTSKSLYQLPIDTGKIFIMANSYSPEERYINILIGVFPALGEFGVYAVQPECSSGTYCSSSNLCSTTSCPAKENDMYSCPTDFCPTTTTCSVDSVCFTGSAGNETKKDIIYLNSLPILSTAEEKFEFTDQELVIPAGSMIGIGCQLAEHCSTGLVLNAMNNIIDEDPDYSIDTLTSNEAVPISFRCVVQFIGRTHQKYTHYQQLTCDKPAPIPNSQINSLDVIEAQAYINQTVFSFEYELKSDFVSSVYTNSNAILCQVAVGTPEYQPNVTMAFGTPYPYTVYFPSGSPIFNKIETTDSIYYHYWDDATNGWNHTINLDYAVDGHYNLSGNASNTLNSVAYEISVAVIPVISPNWIISFVCPCYDVPEGFLLNMDLASAPNPSWSSNVSYEWNSAPLLDSEFVVFETEDKGGVAIPLNINRNVIFTSFGEQTVNITLSNEVSSQTFTKNVTVKEGLRNVTMTYLWIAADNKTYPALGNQDTFLANHTVIVNVSSTGEPESYKCFINETEEEIIVQTSAENITMVFKADGEYHIRCSVYNTVQLWVDSPWKTIIIVSKLQGFDLIDSKMTDLSNMTKEIWATFVVYQPVSCVLIDFNDTIVETYGDEEICLREFIDIPFKASATMSPMKILHTYQEENFYNVTGLASDGEIKFAAETQIIAATIPCKLPILSILNPKLLSTSPQKQYRSLPLNLQAKADIQCNKTVPIISFWTINQVDISTGASYREMDISDLPTRNYPSLVVPARHLENGTYKFAYEVHIKLTMQTLRADVYTYVEIMQSDLISSMTTGGATRINRGFGQGIEFDFRKSGDPDDRPDEEPTHKLTFFSRKLGSEQYPIDLETETYKENQYQVLPIDQPTVENGPGSFGNGLDPIIYPGLEFIFYTKSFVNSEETYEFALQVTKDWRIETSYLVVEVQNAVVPIMTIRCTNPDLCVEHNGKIYVNPTSRLSLTGTMEAKRMSNPIYQWEVFDRSGNEIEILNSYCIAQDILDCRKNELFAISEDFYENYNNIFEFVFRFNGIDDDGIAGFTELVLTVNKPPQDGTCVLLEHEGMVLVSTFHLECSNWNDPEGIGIEGYAIYYIEQNVENAAIKTIVTTLNPSLNLILPYGNLSIFVDITDKLKAKTTVHPGVTRTYLPTKQQVEDYNANDKLAKFAVNNDVPSINMQIVALNSLRDHADYYNLEDETSAGNEALQRLMSESRQFELQTASDIFKIETFQDMQMASTMLNSVLQSVFYGDVSGTNLNLNSKELARNLTNKIINKFEHVTIPGPEELIPIIINLIDSAMASICSDNLIMSIRKFSPVDKDLSKDMDYNTEVTEGMSVPLDRETQLSNNVIDTVKEESKAQVDIIFENIEILFNVVISLVVQGESLTAHSPNNSTVIIGKINEKQLQNSVLPTNPKEMEPSIEFPEDFCPSKYAKSDTDCKQFIEYKFIIWRCVPYYYPVSMKYLSTGAAMITMEIYFEGKLLHIPNGLNINVTIPKGKERNPIEAKEIKRDNDVDPKYFKIELHKNHRVLALSICPDNGTISNNVILYVNVNKLPLINDFLLATRIVDLEIDDESCYALSYNTHKPTNKTISVFVGIAQMKGVLHSKSILSRDSKNFFTPLTSKCTIKTSSVDSFAFDEKQQQWTHDGLEVIIAKNNMVKVKSHHLSSFSIGYFPTINTLDFEYIFAHTGFVDNLSIYITLIVFTSAFVIMFIWGHLMDRKDIEKRGVIALSDNKIEDKYLYEITFWTGPDKEASTSSNIMFIASGEFGETEVRHLPTNDRMLYRRFGVNSFLMATKHSLGYINYFRIFHDNSGEPPLDSWQLQRAIIRDVQTSEKFIFETNTWLALDRCDGLVDKTFNRSANNKTENYSERFYLKGNRILNEDHIWLSIFTRPVGSRYTRKERVLVCAVFIFMSMIVSALWYDTAPDTDLQSYFRIGTFSLTNEDLIVGLIILFCVFPITTVLTYIMKKARPRNLRSSRTLESIEYQRFSQLKEKGFDDNLAELQCKLDTSGPNQQKETNTKSSLPWWTRILAWLISVSLIGASGFFIWAYGIQWDEIKTIKWFSSFLFSFFISILFLQFIKTLVFACISGCFKSDDYFAEDMDCDEESPSLKPDEEWTHVNPLDPSFRKKVHKIEGVNYEDERIAALRIRLFKEREMKYVLRGIFYYIIFLLIIYTIVNSRTDGNSYRLKNHLMNTFLKPGHLKYDFINRIKTANDWWDWCKNVVLQEIRAQRLYNLDPPYGLRGFMDDQANRIMGYAIIRQIRTTGAECVAAPPMNKIIFDCAGIRGIQNEDSNDYYSYWQVNDTFSDPCADKEFKYETAESLRTHTVYANIGSFSGGGYVLRLNGTMESVLQKFNCLHRTHWVDRYTKTLSLEFSLYNPFANLFSTCMVTAEFKEGGGIIPYWRFEPVRLIPNSGISGTISRIAEILFCIATVIFTLKELWQMKKQGCEYFSSYWNRAEIILIIISYTTIGLYVYKYALTYEATAIFKETNGNGYVRMDKAAMVDQYSLYAIGFIVFFSTLKLIKLLQFNNNMNLLALTIRRSWNELKIFLLAFAIVFFAFSCLFFFMFQSDLEQFSSIVYSVMTSFVMMMGKFDYEDMNRVNPLSPLLFFLFSVVNSFILINLMLSIMIQSFTSVKNEMASKENRLNVIEFMWTSFKQHARKETFEKRHVLLSVDEIKDNGQNENENKAEEKLNELSIKFAKLLDRMDKLSPGNQQQNNNANLRTLSEDNDDTHLTDDPMRVFYKSDIKYSD